MESVIHSLNVDAQIFYYIGYGLIAVSALLFVLRKAMLAIRFIAFGAAILFIANAGFDLNSLYDLLPATLSTMLP